MQFLRNYYTARGNPLSENVMVQVADAFFGFLDFILAPVAPIVPPPFPIVPQPVAPIVPPPFPIVPPPFPIVPEPVAPIPAPVNVLGDPLVQFVPPNPFFNEVFPGGRPSFDDDLDLD